MAPWVIMGKMTDLCRDGSLKTPDELVEAQLEQLIANALAALVLNWRERVLDNCTNTLGSALCTDLPPPSPFWGEESTQRAYRIRPKD